MKININKDYSQARWFTLDPKHKLDEGQPELKIRPYPASKEEFIGRDDGSLVLTGKNLMKKFIYCLVDWKGINDEKDQVLPCNESVKKGVYEDLLGGIPARVNECLQIIAEEREKDRKN